LDPSVLLVRLHRCLSHPFRPNPSDPSLRSFLSDPYRPDPYRPDP
jgi:hypothetical protein